MVDKQETNLRLLSACDKMMANRAENTTNAYFKGKIENIAPIFLYTSQLKVRPSLKGSISTLSRHLNVFLRNQSFGQTTDDQYK